MVLIGIILYITDIFYYKKKALKNPGDFPSDPGDPAENGNATDGQPAEGEVCCGTPTPPEEGATKPL